MTIKYVYVSQVYVYMCIIYSPKICTAFNYILYIFSYFAFLLLFFLCKNMITIPPTKVDLSISHTQPQTNKIM